MIEASAGRHIWADKIDGELANLFDLQDQITRSVVGAVEPSLRFREIDRARSKPTSRLDAYDLYLRSLPEIYRLEAEGFLTAEGLLRKAIQIDPHFSDAWAALADCRSRLYNVGWLKDLASVTQECCDAATRAINSDPDSGVALATGAWCLSIFAGHHEQALEFANRAIDRNPHSFYVHARCGWALVHIGEHQRAVSSFETALQLSPIDPERYVAMAGKSAALFFLRQFEQSAEWGGRAHLLKPPNPVSIRFLAAALALADRWGEATEAVQKLRSVWPEGSISLVHRSNAGALRHVWMLELYLEGLRKAGLRER